MPALCQGRICWATVVDRQGGNPKERPIVIVTNNAEIADNDPLTALAASSSAALCNPLPDDAIEIPHHPQGKVGTRLKKPTVVLYKWFVTVRKSDIKETAGIVPPQKLAEILAKAGLAPPLCDAGDTTG